MPEELKTLRQVATTTFGNVDVDSANQVRVQIVGVIVASCGRKGRIPLVEIAIAVLVVLHPDVDDGCFVFGVCGPLFVKKNGLLKGFFFTTLKAQFVFEALLEVAWLNDFVWSLTGIVNKD